MRIQDDAKTAAKVCKTARQTLYYDLILADIRFYSTVSGEGGRGADDSTYVSICVEGDSAARGKGVYAAAPSTHSSHTSDFTQVHYAHDVIPEPPTPARAHDVIPEIRPKLLRSIMRLCSIYSNCLIIFFFASLCSVSPQRRKVIILNIWMNPSSTKKHQSPR